MNEAGSTPPGGGQDRQQNQAVARKHATLREMGVDVWLLRRAEAAASAELSVPADAAPSGGPAPEPVERHRRRLAKAPAEPARTPAPAVEAAPPTRPVGPPVPPFSVVCLSKGPVLMLVELEPAKAVRRFALDVLAASSGMFGGKSAQLAFDWPQPGIGNDERSMRKALGAFVAKQLGDQAPARVLISRPVAERLEQIPEGTILLAPLAELMVDGRQKRALWEELEGRQ